MRVNAEDPAQNFRPAPGTVERYREPGGLGVRVDSAAYPGFTITPDYDSMIAKLIVTARNRDEALARLARAIDEYVIGGVPTTLPLLRALCDFGPVRDASYGTATLEPFAASLGPAATHGPAATNGVAHKPESADGAAAQDQDHAIRVEVNDRLFRVRFVDLPAPARRPGYRRGGLRRGAAGAQEGRRGAQVRRGRGQRRHLADARRGGGDSGRAGAAVNEGDVVAVIEAMKMMNEIRAHKSGTVAMVHVAAGATVEARTPLVTLA